MSDGAPPAWYADDRFWHVIQPWMFPEPFWIAASYEVDSILEMTGQPPDCRVLDLACGPGRTALQFARRGARVTGVDLNAAYLDEARRKADHAGLKADWVQADMRDYVREYAFDLAVCLYNSFGYHANPIDDLLVLRNVHASLSASGHFVLDHLGREICERSVRTDPYVETRAGITVEHRAELNRERSVLRCEWTVSGDGPQEHFVTEQRVYSADAIASLLREAGFRIVTCFGGYERGAYAPESSRLLVVAEK